MITTKQQAILVQRILQAFALMEHMPALEDNYYTKWFVRELANQNHHILQSWLGTFPEEKFTGADNVYSLTLTKLAYMVMSTDPAIYNVVDCFSIIAIDNIPTEAIMDVMCFIDNKDDDIFDSAIERVADFYVTCHKELFDDGMGN